MRFIDAIRSIFFNVIFYGFSIVFLGLVVAPLCLLKSEKPARWGVGVYCHSSVWIARWVMGIRTEYRGREKFPPEGALILAAAHQSNMDPMLSYCLRWDVTAFAKKELFSTLFVGTILKKMQIVSIDRQSKSAHTDMRSVGEEVVRLGRPIIVYPQATRIKPGQYKKLKTGAYFLYQDSRLPVVPVATNTGLFWTKGFWHRSGTVVYEIGDPFPTGLDKDAFMARMEKWVVARSDQLIADAGYGHLLQSSAEN